MEKNNIIEGRANKDILQMVWGELSWDAFMERNGGSIPEEVTDKFENLCKEHSEFSYDQKLYWAGGIVAGWVAAQNLKPNALTEPSPQNSFTEEDMLELLRYCAKHYFFSSYWFIIRLNGTYRFENQILTNFKKQQKKESK